MRQGAKSAVEVKQGESLRLLYGTPAINGQGGRDHFGRAWTVVLAGGGIKGGQTDGASNQDGFEVEDKPVDEWAYFATIYKTKGATTALCITSARVPFGRRPKDQSRSRNCLVRKA